MKYYPKLATIPAFTLNEAARIIGSSKSTSEIISSMIREGSAHRIRNGLYTCVNFGVGDDYASRFQIASKINQDSFISFHSAFEFYGFYNQSYFDVQVCSEKRFSEFSYGNYFYRWFPTRSTAQIKTVQNVKVVSIERAIVDSIRTLGKTMEPEELVKCLDLIHYVDETKILEMLCLYGQERLYRKVGYILSFYKEELSISQNFFEVCKQKGVSSNKGYLVGHSKECLVFDSVWGLYAYGDIRKLASKGNEVDV